MKLKRSTIGLGITLALALINARRRGLSGNARVRQYQLHISYGQAISGIR